MRKEIDRAELNEGKKGIGIGCKRMEWEETDWKVN